MATYTSGAGDGFVEMSSPANNWDTVHNSTNGTLASTALGTIDIQSYEDGSSITIDRGFIPINTSGIDDGATITSAILYLYCWGKTLQDDDAQAYTNVVQTSQASTDALVTDDFETCGDTHSPTVGGTNVSISSVSADAWWSITLNATGISWIDKTGVTKLGVREGHDLEDSRINDPARNRLRNHDEGAANDPYLDVTTSGLSDYYDGSGWIACRVYQENA